MANIRDNDLSHLYLAPSKIQGAGNGVYSKIFIPCECVVERANVIPIKPSKVDGEPIADYVFNNPEKNDEFLIAFGFGSMYNHSDNPHMSYYYDKDNNKIVFEAIRDINAGEEIYISYGTDWWKNRESKKKIDIDNDKITIVDTNKKVSKKTKVKIGKF